ncbi:MAG: YbjQ family protein [Kofleriaceae bacterium]
MTEPTETPAGDDPYRAGYERIDTIIVTTGNDVAGHQIIGYLAIVRGIVVRATSLGKGILGGLKALGGGNIKEFTEVCEAARHDAYQQMMEHAREVGADAIIGMRYDATEFAQGSTEVLVYGTAVRITPLLPG